MAGWRWSSTGLKKSWDLSVDQRRAWVDPSDSISVRRQCELLGIHRSGWYYTPSSPDSEEIQLCHRLDEIYTAHPYFGVRRVVVALRDSGLVVNAKRVRRLLRILGLTAIYPAPKASRGLSDPASAGRRYPYLLRGMVISSPHQVWAVDITYIRLRAGYAYLVAVLDWHSRFVLSWELAPSLETTYCLRTLNQAIELAGIPAGIMNSDQGSQFTSEEWIGAVTGAGMRVSHDGRGRALDNVMIERLWRTVKYEHVYLHDHADLRHARAGLREYFHFYNYRRPHQSLAYQTPAQIIGPMPRKRMAPSPLGNNPLVEA